MNNHECPIIPVLDLMIGQVVLAKAGDRESYRPVHSRLTASSNPVEVAKAMFAQTECREFYLADIDTFEGAAPNWTVYQRLAECGFQLWVDADWTGDRARRLIELSETISAKGAIKPIVSSETLQYPDELRLINQFKTNGLPPIFSLDLKSGKVLTRCENQSNKVESPEHWIATALEQGARQVILLDVANVGTDSGPAHEDLLRTMHRQFPEISFCSGGGVRSPKDALTLLECGCEQVLVASAIHNCHFTPHDVANLTGRSV